MSSAIRPAACLAALLLLAPGCSRQDKDAAPVDKPGHAADAASQTPEKGDWVVQQIPSDPDTLNPITGQDAYGDMIRYPHIFESLLEMDNETLKLKPLLAESYEISPDQLTYTFHLRKNAKWQDGQPLTAEDVKFSYDKLQDPKVDAADKRTYFTTITNCEVLDPYTVRFTAKERYFKTLEALGTNLAIIPKHLLDKDDSDFNKSPFGRNPVGSGPYKFVRWETGSQIVLERDDNYWGDKKAYPKRLVYLVIQEPYVAAQLIKKGDIDIVDGMQPITYERTLAGTRSMERLHEVVYPYPAYSYIGFNLRLPIFSDVRVRHAIDLLIPRDQIIEQIALNKYASKTSGYDPPSSINYNHDVPPTPYDPELAKKLLAEAGWKLDPADGLLHKDGQKLSFTLLYPSGGVSAQKSAELILESLRSAGIDLQLMRMEFAQLISKLDDWKFEACMLSWALDVNGDPSQIWDGSQATVKKSSNFIGYNNPEANKLIAAGRLEYDDEKRAAIYRQLQKVIHDDYPVCFLFNPKVIMLTSKRFQNVKIYTPRPCFDPTEWWVPASEQKYKD
jgi:peptide/nickel transport system substrate-binding protein